MQEGGGQGGAGPSGLGLTHCPLQGPIGQEGPPGPPGLPVSAPHPTTHTRPLGPCRLVASLPTLPSQGRAGAPGPQGPPGGYAAKGDRVSVETPEIPLGRSWNLSRVFRREGDRAESEPRGVSPETPRRSLQWRGPWASDIPRRAWGVPGPRAGRPPAWSLPLSLGCGLHPASSSCFSAPLPHPDSTRGLWGRGSGEELPAPPARGQGAEGGRFLP